jgi:16S rRNA (cytosine967-C5)-methyltransferase
MTLRVDLSRATTDEYVARLAAAGIAAQTLAWRPGAVVLDAPLDVQALPGFAAGEVSVQDAGAQVAAAWLAPRPGERVLDACAAPGGKTAHLLEIAGGDIELTAIDSDAVRLEAVTETLNRVRRTARIVCADLRERSALAGERPFEKILVDAPCSATGVIRRHPDIKLLRRGRDVPGFVATQRAILENVFARLAPGGLLLYVTCSVLAAENEALIEAFLDAHPEAGTAPPPANLRWPENAVVWQHGVQLLPGPGAPTDGFHYASLTRSS